jgi:hypothetical protein
MIRLMPVTTGMKVTFFTLFRTCGRVSKVNFNALLFNAGNKAEPSDPFLQRFRELITPSMIELDYFEKQEL